MPASESFVAFTMIMNRIVVLAFWCRDRPRAGRRQGAHAPVR